MSDPGARYRRLVYRSRATARQDEPTVAEIFRESRLYNGIDGISGLLWADGGQYVQILEGAPETVETTWARIRRDARHTDVEVLSDDMHDSGRIFGDWTMARLPSERATDVADRLEQILRHAPPSVKAAFAEIAGTA